MRVAYRLRQGMGALLAGARSVDPSSANRLLSPGERALFARMAPTDQRHGLAVLRALRNGGLEDESLLKAALLHDAGKSAARVSVVHRTLAVLLKALLGRLPRAMMKATGWRSPFYALEHHAAVGASMLRDTGSSDRTARLVELHEASPEAVPAGSADYDWLVWAVGVLRVADSAN